MNLLILIISLTLSCTVGVSLQRNPRRTESPKFPENIEESQLAKLKIPNKEFCDFMAKGNAGKFLVLPWWHYFCQDLDDYERSKSGKDLYYLALYSGVVKKIQEYRRRGAFVNENKKKTKLNTIFILHLTQIHCKRKYRDSSSEESIENVLYYQDCKHKQDVRHPPAQMRALEPSTTSKPQECRMCCSMCCGDECQNSCNQQKPKLFNPIKKIEPTRPLRPRLRNVPFVRRDSGFTKDNIKALISQDTDIRKILKDLVRVTMQKVDLMQLLNAKRAQNKPSKDSEYENDP